ncbi:dehydrogenase/reductase SDR family protein 7-like [Contarinia nasturtii]|uniref:dehydrogenase/reductase SDR family protein 7-like n=1 Tax=Contarinia nasturtii TaxID=265458 RepID=UPI0012D4AB92|nr:dehydrogenase/reductase SDR family protein 7-like [Contarinia nasturtii]
MFLLILMLILLVGLLAKLGLRYREDKRVKLAREEMPGKVVVLTGANTPLGEALAISFYAAGAKLVLVGPDQTDLERTRTHLFSLRPKNVPVYQPEVVAMDASSPTEFSAQEVVAEIMETCGQVDILINNSMTEVRSDILSTNIEEDIRVMNVNYFGVIAFVKSMLPSMVARKSGKVVFVNNVAGKIAIPFRSSFAAAEHALQAFADTLRAEMALYKVDVLVSNPEYYATEAVEKKSAKKVAEKKDGEKAAPVDPTQQLADDILLEVLKDSDEHMYFSFRFSHWLSVLVPGFYYFMLAARTKKLYKSEPNLRRF